MTTSHHVPHPFGGPLTSAAVNAPLGQLDAAIDQVSAAGSGTSTSLTAQALPGQATLTVANSAGFVAGDPIYIGTGVTFESRIVNNVPNATTIVVTVNLSNLYAIGAPVSKSPVELVDARSGQTTLKGRLNLINSGAQRIAPSGGDDTAAIQSAINTAFNLPGGTVVFSPGTYTVSAQLVTPANTAGAVRLVGEGRVRSFTGGQNGDPTANQGVTINYTGATGSILFASVTTGDKRQYITIDNIYFQGNAAGTSGHGLHFQATIGTVAILVSMRDVTVNGAKQHGIFFDGNVFESTIMGVRCSQNGDRGFKAAANGAGLPGENRFMACSFNQNAVGVDIAGGGHWSFHGLTASSNTAEGLVANGVQLEVFDLQLETNGTLAGNQATITNCTGPLFLGVNITTKVGGTGNGVSFVNALWPHIIRFQSDSSAGGAGYKDIRSDNLTTRGSIEDYASNDFVDRLTLGTAGGWSVRRGAKWQSYQTHAQQAISTAVTGAALFDATLFDSWLLTCTGAGAITVTISSPTAYADYHGGQRVTLHVFNNTTGAVTIAFDAVFHLAGAWVNPASTKTRTITFEYDDTRNAFYEIGRSAADIT